MAALHMSRFLKKLGLFVYKLLVFDLDNDTHKVAPHVTNITIPR